MMVAFGHLPLVRTKVSENLQHFETSSGVPELHVNVAQVLLALVESYSLPVPQKLVSVLMVLQAAFVSDKVPDVLLQPVFILDNSDMVPDILQHFETSPGVPVLHVDFAQVLQALAESYSLPSPQKSFLVLMVLQAAPLLAEGLQVFVS